MGCGISLGKSKLRKEFKKSAYSSMLKTDFQRRMKKKGMFVINEVGNSQEFSCINFHDCED